jgi:hypothetical protein
LSSSSGACGLTCAKPIMATRLSTTDKNNFLLIFKSFKKSYPNVTINTIHCLKNFIKLAYILILDYTKQKTDNYETVYDNSTDCTLFN